jgi:two-component system chemotaxis response regulator CheV
MHSSLSGMSNQQLGRSVGVDEYVAKFEPQRLAEVLRRLITQHAAAKARLSQRRSMMNMDRVDRGLLEAVDARTKLAGSNRMEILLFSLGTQEIFGINVFKVREVSRTPFITKAPNMPVGVEGLISLRGNVIPVLALAKVMGISEPGDPSAVDDGHRVQQAHPRLPGPRGGSHHPRRVGQGRAPDNVTSGGHHFITAITELQDGKLVSILDVETILASTFGEAVVGQIHPSKAARRECVLRR